MSTQSDPLKVTAQELQSTDVRRTALIVSGCSFSAGDSNMIVARTQPTVWSDYFLRKFKQVRQYVNLAIPGAGNMAMCANVIDFLESNKTYSDSNTLLLFNISGFDRVDVMCDRNHPDKNIFFSWSHAVDHDWVTSGGFIPSPNKNWLNLLVKNMGLDCIQKMNALSIVQMISYLELRQFAYGFMLMNDDVYDAMPSWLHTWFAERQLHKINLDGQNMHEFCRTRNSLDKDQFHPNQLGHELIANAVISHCQSNGII